MPVWAVPPIRIVPVVADPPIAYVIEVPPERVNADPATSVMPTLPPDAIDTAPAALLPMFTTAGLDPVAKLIVCVPPVEVPANTLKVEVPVVNAPPKTFTTLEAPVTEFATLTVVAPAPLAIRTLLVPEEEPE